MVSRESIKEDIQIDSTIRSLEKSLNDVNASTNLKKQMILALDAFASICTIADLENKCKTDVEELLKRVNAIINIEGEKFRSLLIRKTQLNTAESIFIDISYCAHMSKSSININEIKIESIYSLLAVYDTIYSNSNVTNEINTLLVDWMYGIVRDYNNIF